MVRYTGIGRAPRFSGRIGAEGLGGALLVESAPSVVAELARRIELITCDGDGRIASDPDARQVPAVTGIEHLTAEAGRAVLAENYAAYVAKYGEPA
jgi:hypothetical protein